MIIMQTDGRSNGLDCTKKVIDINKNKPHKYSEVICVHCGKRWWAVRPVETQLRELECPECTNQGYVIETGETIE